MTQSAEGVPADPDQRAYAGQALAQHPSADTPSISEHRIQQEAFVAVFSADVWPMNALASNPSRPLADLRFGAWPPGFRDFAKHVAYVLINHGNPDRLADRLNGNYVKWPSTSTIGNILLQLRAHVEWLVGEWSARHPETPVRTPRDLDSEHLNECRRRIEQTHSVWETRYGSIERLVRVWHLNPWLPEEHRWPEPTWRDENWKPSHGPRENATKRLSQATMGPLLEWSTAFVTAFADDILAAHTHFTDRMRNLPEDEGQHRAARLALEEYIRSGTPFPNNPAISGTKRTEDVGWHVLSYRHGIDNTCLGVTYAKMSARHPVSADPSLAALDLQLTGAFHGRPWTPFIGVYDVKPRSYRQYTIPGPLLSHLRTACMIVAGYLTGARPEEICSWEHGAAPAPRESPGGARLHLIHGRVWKGRRAARDGRPGTGEEAAWVTIPVATRAIHTAEQIAQLFGRESGPLFSDTGKKINATTSRTWIRDFVCFINERLVPHSLDPQALRIPEDPEGAITLRRFRRTLAWFIRNRPNGEVTAAIQYQHLGTALSGGYSGTKESGMNDLMAEEDWLHRRRTMEELRLLFDAGKGLSGPAARRAINAVEKLPRQLTPADERRLRRDDTMLVYDNPAALALCIYDEEKALCRKIKLAGNDNQPSLLECVDGCRNCARTDKQLEELEAEAAAFQANALVSPLPLAQAFMAQSERNLHIGEQFRGQRICPKHPVPSKDDR